ncbi:hypothetical protein BDA96_01G480700 [Sorghum bicolor]|uniref:Potassium channel tetramerisation-type BTB domain-containing protein n=2 Tax=Sorghum bicolor TaxID=4558 RepID=A0A921S5Y7_SORBI|nr:hypothetical protein BDA96_01G480700 [Sorghum bicolor]OQU92975.1 hypothetical protein SORBI_3001G451150 [Sorghum bicolor]
MLGALLDASWNVSSSSPGGGVAEYFVDRNPACFAVPLDLLRMCSLHVPPHLPEKLLYREALYYGLLVHVRTARWGAFDSDRLRLAASVPGRAPGDSTAIRSSPDGGCCVAHGGAVRVYNWMLDERRPVSLDHSQVPAVAVSVSMRDVGTEMTPIASQEQSRSGTPAGAATSSLSALCSVPSSPRGEEGQK